MFGHQDDQDSTRNSQDSSNDASTPPTSSISPPIQNQDLVADLSLGSGDGETNDASNPSWQHPGEAIAPPSEPQKDVISPAGGFPQALSSKEPTYSPTPASNMHVRASVPHDGATLADATDDDLIEVKDKALDELYPLIDKLDQTPEEHFRTLMMIIQASDNHALVQQAYQIAQTINDEKARAQALLDIINEINYFTQQPEI